MPTVYKELCLLLGESAFEISLVGTEKEGIGMIENIHIHKHLKHI